MNKYIKHVIFVSLIAMLFTIISIPKASFAKTDYRLDIKVESGINGKAQQQKGFPITITVTNNKADFSGDLLLTVPKDYEAIGNIVIPIDIAAGTTKEILVSVPSFEPGYLQTGPNPNQKVQLIHLYEGSWKDGKELSVDKSLKITPSYLPDNRLVVGVLSNNPDALNYIKLSSFYGNSPEVLKLTEREIPNDPVGLEVLDVLMINDYSIASLPKDKQGAIREWINKGGQVIVGSTTGLSKEMGDLADLLPLEITGSKQLEKLSKLEELSGEKLPTGSYEVFTGNLNPESNVTYSEGKDAFVSKLDYGQGKITQLSFDLSNSDITELKGYEKAWQAIASSIITAGAQDEESKHRVRQFSEEMSYLSTMFQSLAKIPLSVLVISFFVYVFIAAPILYFILKRFDKREWSWVIIPSIAVICSIALYFVGAKDRIGQIQSNTKTVVLLDGKGNGSGYGSVAMLSKDAGDYVLGLDASFHPFPGSSRRYVAMDPASEIESLPVVETTNEQAEITFQAVEYWSPRSASIRIPKKDYGMFETDITYKDGKITGTIANTTQFDFKELAIVSGNNHIKIGELKAGDSIEINETFNQTNLFQSPNEQVAFNIYGNPNGFMRDPENESKERMMQMAFWMGLLNQGQQGPVLVGFSNDEIVDFTVNGKDTKNNDQNLFVQTLPIGISKDLDKPLSVNITIPSINVINGQLQYNGLMTGDHFIDASPGIYEFVYEIPEALKSINFKMNELKFSVPSGGPGIPVAYEIYNQKTASYEEFSVSDFDKITKENLKNYVSENGQIRLRTGTTSSIGPIAVPTVVIKGGPNQ